MLKITRSSKASALIAIKTNKDEIISSSNNLKPNVTVKGFLISKAKIIFIKLR